MRTDPARESDGVGFTLRLTPKGGHNAIDGWGQDADGRILLRARVAAPPENGRANDALAAAFAVPKSAVTIAAGANARIKRIRIGGDQRTLSARLNQFGDAK